MMHIKDQSADPENYMVQSYYLFVIIDPRVSFLNLEDFIVPTISM